MPNPSRFLPASRFFIAPARCKTPPPHQAAWAIGAPNAAGGMSGQEMPLMEKPLMRRSMSGERGKGEKTPNLAQNMHKEKLFCQESGAWKKILSGRHHSMLKCFHSYYHMGNAGLRA